MFDHTMIFFTGVSCIEIWCMSSSREASPGAVFGSFFDPKMRLFGDVPRKRQHLTEVLNSDSSSRVGSGLCETGV